MNLNNATLLGRNPGGFTSRQVIYPEFEILGSYSSSHRLPTAPYYTANNQDYDLR